MLFPKLQPVLRHMNRLMQLFIALAVPFSATGAMGATCQEMVKPVAGSTYEITVNTATGIRKLPPEFFGFNLEWVEFQGSLWDSTNNRVKPDAVEFLKAFPGAVYRYPGGLEANYFEWNNAIGDLSLRKAQKAVTWTGPLVAKFGLPEYLNFMQSVGGKPWYVVNLYGSLAGERPSADLAREAGALATYLRQQRTAGKPAIFRWELGNELDRNNYLWSQDKYASTASAALTSILIADGSAKAVVMSQDYDASLQKYGVNSATYNAYLGRTFKGKTTEFASHRYYDGMPWGPPVAQQVQQECKNIYDLTQGLLSTPGMWITEHARTPTGTSSDPIPQANWPQTANLSGAISVSDILIAFSQIPAVSGAMTHALHATTGPWPLFHLNSTGGVVPSAVYWGMRTLRESLLEDVLATRVVSANQSGYAGGYDLRGVALANAQRNQFSVWLTNRAKTSIRVKLTLPSLAGNTIYSDVKVLGSSDPTINNYGGVSRISPSKTSLRLVFDGSGQTYLDVPANAVMTVALSKTIASPTTTTPATPTSIAINAGGAATGSFLVDKYYSGGTVASNAASTTTINTSGTVNPAPQAVYRNERYGKNFTYTVPGLTPSALYKVRLHFVEAYWSRTGRRTFNVLINGNTVLSNFDIFASAGAKNKAVIREFNAYANSSGSIVIQFATKLDNAKVDGIEILATTTTPKP